MHTIKVFLQLFAAVVAHAHFQLQVPPPRGPFVMNVEPTFCDGYTEAGNRSLFPLDNGQIILNSEHPQWSAEVFISIDQNPDTAALFNASSNNITLPLAVKPFTASGEGLFCFPIDIGALNIPNVGNGSNVSIQIEFNGGDGNLFQCADLTLSTSVTIPPNSTCTNLTSTSTFANSSGSSSNSSSSNSSSSNGTSSGSGSKSDALALLPLENSMSLFVAFAGMLGAFILVV